MDLAQTAEAESSTASKTLSLLSGSPTIEKNSPEVQIPCNICRKRKVRCNKELPCSNCQRLGFECSYDDPSRGLKRAISGTDSTRDTAELSGRMVRLESLVRNLSKQPGLPRPDPSWENTLPSASRPADSAKNFSKADVDAGKLVMTSASSRHVVSSFWAGLFDEIDNLKFLIEEEELGSNKAESFPFFFSSAGRANIDIAELQPTRANADLLFSIYFKNIHPFIMMLHKPRFFYDLSQFRRGSLNHSPVFEGLLFSIYYIAIMSLSDEYVMATFSGESKTTLLSRYQMATEMGLKKSGFMQSHDLISLQTLLLYLVCLFEQNEHTQASALLGLALRIARRIGIHRDGTHFNLSPWAIEMRRRTWQLLRRLDVKALESQGAEPETFLLKSDTALPQNSPDSAWDPCEYSPKAPKPEESFTEMTYSLVQFELASIFQSILDDAHPLPNDVQSYVDFHGPRLQFEKDRIDSRYLKNLDLTDPIQRFTHEITDLTFFKLFLVVHQPLLKLPYKKGEISQDLKEKLFVTAIGVCETSHYLEKEYRDCHWDWVLRNSIQWHAIAIILTNLLHRVDDPDVARAWKQIDIIFETHNNTSLKSGDAALWRPLKRLWAEATGKRNEQQAFPREQVQSFLTGPMEEFAQLQDPVFDQWFDPAVFGDITQDFPL